MFERLLKLVFVILAVTLVAPNVHWLQRGIAALMLCIALGSIEEG